MRILTRPLLLLLIGLLLLGYLNPFIEFTPIHSPVVFRPSASVFHSSELLTNQSSFVATTGVPVDSSSVALVREVQSLAAQLRAELVPSSPGWLHLIIRREHSSTDSPALSNSSTPVLQLEQWLSLDSQGRVQVGVQRPLDYQGSDATFLSGGNWLVLPLAGFTSSSSTLPFDPAYGIDTLVAQLVNQGQTINKSLLYKECWYQGDKYTLSDGQTIHEIVVKPDSHALRWIKTWQVNAGVITLVDSLEIALEERLPQPPEDILALTGHVSSPGE
jgi:hypothetical protein